MLDLNGSSGHFSHDCVTSRITRDVFFCLFFTTTAGVIFRNVKSDHVTPLLKAHWRDLLTMGIEPKSFHWSVRPRESAQSQLWSYFLSLPSSSDGCDPLSPHPRSLLGVNEGSSSVSTHLNLGSQGEKTLRERNGESKLVNMHIGPSDGVCHRKMREGPHQSHRAMCLEGPLHSVWCSAVTILKFLIIFEQRVHRFHFALGLALCRQPGPYSGIMYGFMV